MLPKTGRAYWRIWLSARLLPLRAAGRDLEDLLKDATPKKAASHYAALGAEDIVATIQAVTRKPWLMRSRRCLRQGLLAFRYLSLAGENPALHFAIAPDSVKAATPRAHCWVDIDGATVLNPPAEPMIELFVFRGGLEPHQARDLAHVAILDG